MLARRILSCLVIWLCWWPSRAPAETCDFGPAIDQDDLVGIRTLLDRGCDPNLAAQGREPPLYQAAMNDQRKAARMLLDHGAHPTARDLPFRLVADTDTSLMRMLLDHGLDVNARNEDGQTLLHVATTAKYSNDPHCESADCWHGYSEMVRFLLARGAKPSLQDKYGLTPLHLAIGNDLKEVAWILAHARGSALALADNCGTAPLDLAARRGNVRLVRYFLERGANPNQADEGGDTPLHSAAWGFRNVAPQIRITKLLARKKAKLAAQNDQGRTPLHLAASFAKNVRETSPDLGRVLVQAGAPIDIRDNDGRTPLHEAALNGNADLLALLLRRGADPNAKDRRGLTPLHWFGAYGSSCSPMSESWTKTAELLTRAGARVGETDAAGRTPLWLVIARGHPELAGPLLAVGAKVADLGPRRATVLHVAALHDEARVMETLLRLGAAPDARDGRDMTPLHWAAIEGSKAAATVLLKRGADRSAIDANGRTSLDLAMLACEGEMAEVLRAAGARPGRSQPPIKDCERAASHPIDDRLDQAAAEYQTGKLKDLVHAGIALDARDRRGRTPLHLIAAHFYLEEELRLLLERGADAKARDDEGMTPLHYAASDGREMISRLLLSAGADPNAADVRGRTPLHVIPFRNDVKALAALLLEKGADASRSDRLGRTALHSLCYRQDQDRARAEALVCRGANPDQRDKLGWNAADLAAIQGWLDTTPAHCGEAGAEYLESKKAATDRDCLIFGD